MSGPVFGRGKKGSGRDVGSRYHLPRGTPVSVRRRRRRRPSPKLKQMPREPTYERKSGGGAARRPFNSSSAPILPLPLSSTLRLNYHAVSIFPMENKRSLALPLNLAFIARTKNAFGSQICEFTAFGLLSKINGGAALAVQSTRSKANCMQDGCTEGTTIRARFRGSNYNFWVK